MVIQIKSIFLLQVIGRGRKSERGLIKILKCHLLVILKKKNPRNVNNEQFCDQGQKGWEKFTFTVFLCYDRNTVSQMANFPQSHPLKSSACVRRKEQPVPFAISYNYVHGWLRGQKNKQQNNSPNPKKQCT